MYTLPLEATYLHRFGRWEQAGRFFPYVGLGLSAFLSMEKISASGLASGEDWFVSFDSKTTGLGASGGIHALLGTEFKIAGTLHALLEVKWILSSNGTPAVLADDTAQKTLDATLFDAVKMSNLNFSGWSVALGFINLSRNEN
jgi:hypothetical protein